MQNGFVLTAGCSRTSFGHVRGGHPVPFRGNEFAFSVTAGARAHRSRGSAAAAIGVALATRAPNAL